MDTALFMAINGLAGHVDAIDDAFELVSRYGPWVLLGVLALLWFWPAPGRERREQAVLVAALGTAAALLVNQALVHPWSRPRPFTEHPATLLLPPSHDPSFPSDHAAFAFAIAVALLLGTRRLGAPVLPFAALLAFSRVYTGEHYVSAVAAGAAVGAAGAAAAYAVRGRLEPVVAPALRLARRLRLA